MNIVIAIAAWSTFLYLYYRWRKRQAAIPNPRLGLLDLTAGGAGHWIAEDKAALTDLFSSVVESTDESPLCDVLFLYARIEDGGRIVGTDRSLRAIIRDADAKVVVVATEHSNPNLGPRPDYGHANLVVTIERNGSAFPTFFRDLFRRMKKGSTMPWAWNRLAPQIPNHPHPGVPSTFFLCELGGISFR